MAGPGHDHGREHDYHILPPSPWPLLGAVSAFAKLRGAVYAMHGQGAMLFGLGFLGVFYTMVSWRSDVVRESRIGDHTPVVQIGLRYGMLLFILSEVMVFAAWFWTFFKHAIYPAEGVWPPVGVESFDLWHLPLIKTLILLASGATVTRAHHALIENNRKNILNALLTVASACCSPCSRPTSTATPISASPATSMVRASSWRPASTAPM